MWNHEITLISKKVTGKDKLLQPISEDVEVTLLCRKKRVTRSEFYQANQVGLKPSLVVEIRNFEYENQELAAYSDEVTEEVDKIAEQVTDETVDELKETSPKRYGKYRRSWKKKKLANGSFVVFNAVASLTHILENGHLSRNGGRVAGIVHIKPAEEKAIQNFEKRIKEIGK